MVGERPLLGIGPGPGQAPLPALPPSERAALERAPSAQRFLQVAAERGLPALGALLALLGGSALAAWRGLAAAADGAADLHLGVLGALTAFAVAGLFENNWGDTEVQRYVLFLLAVPFCLAVAEDAGA